MASAKIGPNSIIQTIRVMTESYGREHTEKLLHDERYPWGSELPTEMVNEEDFLLLVHVLVRSFGIEEARRILSKSGDYTAAYLLAHRIPKPMKWIFPLLPRSVRLNMLMSAIGKHAWTFAGSGRFQYIPGETPTFVIDDCITSRNITSEKPFCSFYEATFTGLLSALVDPQAQVEEKKCRVTGHSQCVFIIRYSGCT